ASRRKPSRPSRASLTRCPSSASNRAIDRRSAVSVSINKMNAMPDRKILATNAEGLSRISVKEGLRRQTLGGAPHGPAQRRALYYVKQPPKGDRGLGSKRTRDGMATGGLKAARGIRGTLSGRQPWM